MCGGGGGDVGGSDSVPITVGVVQLLSVGELKMAEGLMVLVLVSD